jgi:hypothetical protein
LVATLFARQRYSLSTTHSYYRNTAKMVNMSEIQKFITNEALMRIAMREAGNNGKQKHPTKTRRPC